VRIRTALALLLGVVGLLVPVAPAVAAPDHVRLDGVDVALRAGTRQVVTVNRTSGYHARVSLWSLRDGHWRRLTQVTDGRIGYGGLVPGPRRRQNTGTTPLGTFELPWAFGMHRRDDSWDLRYRKVRSGDFWVQDNMLCL
jgi:L,D-peptidoglycan transpeptidase YkuD (ErfK/YbiS/YcfS/YnhG family)